MTTIALPRARGFSLIELLVAMTICAIVSASVAVVVPAARTAFDAVPAELDLQQRARTAADALSQAIRAAGADAVVSDALGALASVVPPVIPDDAVDGHFTALKLIGPRLNGGQGVLARHQDGSYGELWLAASPCPDAALVCGFTRGSTALITDGSGRFDVFIVSAVDAVTRRLSADRAFVPPYGAGAIVVEAAADTIRLDAQPDGSHALVRVSAAGAVLPVIDGVENIVFDVSGFDDAGMLAPFAIGTLDDGPWFRGLPGGLYDEDVFRIRLVDVALTLRGASPAGVRRTIRFGVALRNVR